MCRHSEHFAAYVLSWPHDCTNRIFSFCKISSAELLTRFASENSCLGKGVQSEWLHLSVIEFICNPLLESRAS
jgi:hypothetical protein